MCKMRPRYVPVKCSDVREDSQNHRVKEDRKKIWWEM